MLKNAIAEAAVHMMALYELSGGIEHDGEKGAFREFFLYEMIRPILPFHFGVGSGVVVDAYGRQSHQTDVIIYDRRKLQPISLAGDRGIFPIDSVLVVIEVKSEMKASYYSNIVEAAKCFSPRESDSLRIGIPGKSENQQAIYPLFSLFSYTSDAEKKDELTRLEEQVPGGQNYLKLIGILKKGVWSRNNGVFTSTDVGAVAVKYFLSLLNLLEDIAGSRGDYRLQDWLD